MTHNGYHPMIFFPTTLKPIDSKLILCVRARETRSTKCSKKCGAANISLSIRGESKHLSISCGLLLLQNLAEPRWIFVNCMQPVVEYVFCVKKHTNLSFINLSQSELACEFISIQHNSLCYSVALIGQTDQKLQKSNFVFDSFEFLLSVFSVIKAISFPLFFHESGIHSCSRYLNIYDCQPLQNKQPTPLALGLSKHFLVNFVRKIGGNLIVCDNKVVISLLHMCDGNCDCSGFCGDEKDCSLKFSMLKTNNGNESCKKNKQNYTGIQKTIGQQKTAFQVQSAFSSCASTGLFSCSEETHVCYSIANVCLYQLTSSGVLIPCPLGEHLYKCNSFQCNIEFKCPTHFCIPWGYVCDGKLDCPAGADENLVTVCSEERNCTNLFKCQNSSRCIHLGNTCDGIQDCTFGDDEVLCQLHQHKCPSNCQCLGLHVFCFGIMLHEESFSRTNPYKWLKIERCTLGEALHSFHFPQLHTINILNSGLTELCFLFQKSLCLVFLNASLNIAQTVWPNCFTGNEMLQSLILSNNQINSLRKNGFWNLKNLRNLDLSYNCLQHLSNFVKVGLLNLQVFTFQVDGNTSSWLFLSKKLFDKISLKKLQTNNYQLCCLAPKQTQCTMNIPWYVGCKNLLPSIYVAVTFYMMSALILVVNIVSLCTIKLSNSSQTLKTADAFSNIVVFINFSDIIYSVSLFILWVADLVYRDEYVLFDFSWRSGAICFTHFGLVVNFSFVYPALLIFLSLSRLMITEHPFDSKFKEANFSQTCLVCISTVSLIISSLLTLWAKVITMGHGLPFSICSPYIDPTKSVIVFKIVTWLLSLYSTLVAFAIVAIYCRMFSLIKSFAQQVTSMVGSPRETKIRSFVLHLVVITASNLLCWIPTSVMYITASFIQQYPTDMLIWTQVAITPINSVVNPVVFIVTTLRGRAAR